MANVIDVNKLCMGCMSLLDDMARPCPKCGYDPYAQPPEAHQLRLQSILNGKYITGRALGEGGFGITYLGWDLNLDIRVAIKEFFPVGFAARDAAATTTGMVRPGTADRVEIFAAGLERFLREAKSVAKFSSLPGIVAVRDFFRENGTAYMVMEYINGITLKQHLANSGGRLRPNEAFELLRPLLKSLAYVHAEGVIHRDISPDNIMLSNKNEIKLLDFGAAGDFINEGEKTYSVLLKPGYAPVEQYQTRGVQGPFTDVYALCATIYKMITGQTPPESLSRIERDTLVPPSALGVQISPQAERALLRGLSVNRQNRYQSMGALYTELYGPTQNGILPSPAAEFDNRASGAIEKAAIKTVSGDGSARRLKVVPMPEGGEVSPAVHRNTMILFLILNIIAFILSLYLVANDNDYTGALTAVCVNMVYRIFTVIRKKDPSLTERRIHTAELIIIAYIVIFSSVL